jgi:ubiquinone biosynthesis protein UbiJ
MTEKTTLLAKILSNAINKLIQYDPNSIKKLKPLAGKKVKITIQPINQSIVLLLQDETIVISTDDNIEVDTTISGKPTALFAMSTNQHIPGLDGVGINGDASTGQFVADFLKNLRPDWEDAWCDLLGEVPGYHVSQLIKTLSSAGKSFVDSVRNSSKEFLLEENRELISGHEMEDFLDQVDDLSADVTRLEKKLQLIKNKT